MILFVYNAKIDSFRKKLNRKRGQYQFYFSYLNNFDILLKFLFVMFLNVIKNFNLG